MERTRNFFLLLFLSDGSKFNCFLRSDARHRPIHSVQSEETAAEVGDEEVTSANWSGRKKPYPVSPETASPKRFWTKFDSLRIARIEAAPLGLALQMRRCRKFANN